MSAGLMDRLRLDESRIRAMAQGMEQVAALPDPVGEVMEQFERPNGLHIEKRRVPLAGNSASLVKPGDLISGFKPLQHSARLYWPQSKRYALKQAMQ